MHSNCWDRTGPVVWWWHSPNQSQGTPMNFEMSDRQRQWLDRVTLFIKTHVEPAVPVYNQQMSEGTRWKPVPVLEELKARARAEGLWNMALPPSEHEDDEFHGAGLSN